MKIGNQRLSVIIIILALLLTGCNVNEKVDDSIGSSVNIKQENRENIAPDELWNVEYQELTKEYSYMMISEEAVYGSYIENGQAFIECINKGNGEVEKKFQVSNVPYIKYFNIDEEGYFNIIGQEEECEIFIRIASDGGVIEMNNFVLEDLEGVEYNYRDCSPRGFYRDSDGVTYIWYNMIILETELNPDAEENVYVHISRLYVKDEQLRTIFYEEIQEQNGIDVWDFGLEEGSIPFFTIRDTQEVYRQELDVEKQTLGKKTLLEWPVDIDVYNRAFQVKNGFCFRQVQGYQVLVYDYKDQKCKEIVELSRYGFARHQIRYMVAQQDKVEIIAIEPNEKKLEYIVLKEGKSDKQVITLGTTRVSNDLSRAISYFNSHNDELQVQVISYWDGEGSYEDAIEKLKLDIISGKAPDVIEVSDAYMSILVQKGVFSDLYTFMKEDKECQKEMSVENILALHEKDGCLYSISPAFYLYSMWGSSSVVQGHYGISLEELQELLIYNEKDMSAIYGFYSGTPVLTTLCTFGMDELVDWESGSCNFEGEYFADLLNFAKEYEQAQADDNGNYSSIPVRVNEGEILLSGGMLCSVVDYQIQKEIFGGELDIIGYPTNKGSGTAASFWGSQLAINSASNYQEEAWAFVKTYLLHGYNEMGFPLIKTQFETVLQEAMEKEYVMSEDAVTKLEVAKGGFATTDADIVVYEASQEDVETVRWMVENASQRMQRYKEIQDIIDEEAQAYLQGQKSLEETTKIIQNRVTLYLEEQL